MKILLIEPPSDRFIGYSSECIPLGLSYISAFLREAGHEVFIYNADHSQKSSHINIVEYSSNQRRYLEAVNDPDHFVWKEITEVIKEHNPEIVGITVMSVKVLPAFKLISLIKEINKKIIIVCGGHHPTIEPEKFLNNMLVDFVVRGEGERTIAKLMEIIEKGEVGFGSIKGLSFRKEDRIFHCPERELLDDLDRLPLPDKENIIFKDTYNQDEFSTIMTSRGCPYACGFCGSINMWQRKVRYRSIDKILKEIIYLKRVYKTTNIKFMDDSFSVNGKRVKELCQAMINNKINITWECLTRVNLVEEELIRLMKTAGCTKVSIGIESGNSRVLKLIDKNITLEQVEEAVKILRKYKIFFAAFFMFGFPTETYAEVMDTLRFMKILKPGWANMSIFTPYPGTKLYKLCLEKQIIDKDYDTSKYMHQRIDNFATDKISKEQFAYLATKMLKEVNNYNRSLSSLFKRALSRNYSKNYKLFFEDLKKLANWLKIIKN